jgi:hypothetical protein
MVARKKNGVAALDDTRQLLADTTAQIEDLRRRRAEELRGNADESELDRLDGEIKRLEVIASRHRERIALLEGEAREAEAERRTKEKATLIDRLEKMLGDRRAAALEISEGIAKADAGLRRLINLARDVQAAWPWSGYDLQPCLLAPSAIVTAVTHELYRIGARPLLGGGMDKFGAGINFPGGKPQRIERAGMPDSIPPLAKVVDQASELASQILRGRSPIAGATVVLVSEADRQATPAQIQMAQLIKRQNKLANDVSPAGEVAYQACVAEISRVAALLEAEKQGGTNG